MKSVVPLVRVVHGSHLYGTSTPSSDQDFKGVHLPSGENILLGRAEDVIDRGVVSKTGTKNNSDAVDEQSFSLQKFFDMLMKGDTVATEILFAPTLEQAGNWYGIQTVGRSLLNRQCKGFVGYCQRQAAKYGIKGSRMNAVKTLLDFLNIAFQQHKDKRLEVVEKELHELSAPFIADELMGWENIPSPNGKDLWHIVCCDRKMPMTTKIVEAYLVYQRVWNNYGERARQAANNEGIDWKAVSHAIRVAQQAIELLNTGHITFPRPEADYLLKIKLGEYPYKGISEHLEALVEEVEHASRTSKLPESSDREVADLMILNLYHGQVV
jgi:predicted nucleotidyltransferase